MAFVVETSFLLPFSSILGCDTTFIWLGAKLGAKLASNQKEEEKGEKGGLDENALLSFQEGFLKFFLGPSYVRLLKI